MPTHTDESTRRPARDGSDDLRNASRGQRLQRVMAEAGVASRRVCEQLIEAGRVKVNGQVVSTLPAWVNPSRDRVLVDGQPIQRPEPHVYIMLNKPARTLATPPDGPDDTRRSALAMVEHPLSARLFAAGRLDYDATGLLLLTNDGDLANRLTHARYGVEKTYQMVVRGTMDDESLDRVNRAIAQVTRRAAKDAGLARAARTDLTIVARDQGRTVLQLSVRDGRAVLVRDTLAALGHPVKNMERVAIGPLRLQAVAPGQWRELERDELSDLRRVAAGKPARSSVTPPPRAGGPSRRRPAAPLAEPRRIAKRFRGIGKPTEPSRPTAARPTRKPARTRAEPADAGARDRRLGRGDAINAYRKKPAKPTPSGDRRPARGEDTAERPGRSARPDRPARSDRPVRSDRPARPDRAAHSDRPDRPAKQGRPGKQDRLAKSPRPARGGGPPRADRSPPAGRPARNNRGKAR